MINQVHYLIQHPDGSGLIYPQEVDIANYYGFGGFYLLGLEKDPLLTEYSFAAVHGNEEITTRVVRYGDTKKFYQVEVIGVGKFMFHAQSIPKKIPYTGESESIKGKVALRRIRSWKPEALDNACRQHNFYFVGYSTTIG